MSDLLAQLTLSLGPAYLIDREISGGRSSRMFVAHEESLDRDVVVKVLFPEFTQGLSAERFARGMHLATMLDESHTLPVLTFGQTANGLFFYTMPYVRAESLRQRIDKGPVGFDESVSVLRQIAHSLTYAHGKGFVHGNLKPENVLLAKETAIVTDFGLFSALQFARTITIGGTLTHEGTLLGSPTYMAPERIVDDPITDHRADIYAWGVIAYELLFDADPLAHTGPPDSAEAYTSEFPFVMLYKRHGLPEQLATLVMRCLERDPAARPTSGAELLTVLDRIPDGRIALELERKSATRWAVASVAVGFALFIASGFAVWRMQSSEEAKSPLVAVLPFESPGTMADSLFAEGIADALSTRLSHLTGLRVIDRESVLSVRNAADNARAAGKLLGAAYVVRASMRRLQGPDGRSRLEISPSILNVADGSTKWPTEPEVVSLADPFTVEISIAKKVAQALGLALDSREQAAVAERGTHDTAAFSAFTRGNRLYRQGGPLSLAVNRQALGEFERAYRLDPRYADGLGSAASALLRIERLGVQPPLVDSVVHLAQRAIARVPGHSRALSALAALALAQDNPEDALIWVERAVNANPSSVEALQLRVELLPLIGDTAGTWRDVEQLAALAPRSPDVLVSAATGAQTLRRFGFANELLQHARALEPERLDLILRVATLARAEGRFQRMAGALRDFRKRGGQLSAADLALLRVGDVSMQRELAGASPEVYHAASRDDSITFYTQKAQLFLARRDAARALTVLDSAAALVRPILSDSTKTSVQRVRYREVMAWIDAARRERAHALAVVTAVERAPFAQQWPTGQFATLIACNGAQIYALLDVVEDMITQLRRCLTLPGGLAPGALMAEPALWRHAPDPRLRALLGEFNVQIRRIE